jgi:Tol biopolymer transport system component
MKKFLRLVWTITFSSLLIFLAGCAKTPTSTIIYHDNTRAGLWRMLADGSQVTQLTTSGWYGEYSPDNSRIAYAEFYDNGIWVVNADGSNPIQLTTYGGDPSWSPDSRQLVFSTGGSSEVKSGFWLMNSDDTNLHFLPSVPGSFPDWSPSGEKIIFHGEVNNGIWLINPDGTGETMLYREGGYPAWSPDGEKIAYVNLSDWYIWVMDADGTGNTKISDHPGDLPAWSADGLHIAYEIESIDKKVNGIWVVNSDGSSDHRINEVGRHPDWSK